MPMCDKSPQHLSSLLSVIQKASAAPDSPPPKKDSGAAHDAAEDARRCALAAIGSIVQLKDSSKHLRNVIATLLQALSDDTGHPTHAPQSPHPHSMQPHLHPTHFLLHFIPLAVACEALESLLRISEQAQPEALAGVLGACIDAYASLHRPHHRCITLPSCPCHRDRVRFCHSPHDFPRRKTELQGTRPPTLSSSPLYFFLFSQLKIHTSATGFGSRR